MIIEDNKKIVDIIEGNKKILKIIEGDKLLYNNLIDVDFTLTKNFLNDAPDNLLDHRYGHNDLLSIDSILVRHSTTTYVPNSSYISTTYVHGERCFILEQGINSTAENRYVMYGDRYVRNKRNADTNWAIPSPLKLVGNASEEGNYTLTAKIKAPRGKTIQMNSDRISASRGYNATVSGYVTGNDDWQKVSVTQEFTIANPYIDISFLTFVALNGEPFYVKDIAIVKGDSADYYPTNHRITGNTYPSTSKIVANASVPLDNVGSILNQSVSPYATTAYTGTGTATTGKHSNDVYFRFPLGVPSDAIVKQLTFIPVVNSSRASALRLSEHIGFVNYTAGSKIMSRYGVDSNWSTWDSILQTGAASQRAYPFRNTEVSQIQNIAGNNTDYGFNFMFRNHYTSASTTGTVYMLRAQALYKLPQKTYVTQEFDLEEMNFDLTLKNDNSIGAYTIDLNNVTLSTPGVNNNYSTIHTGSFWVESYMHNNFSTISNRKVSRITFDIYKPAMNVYLSKLYFTNVSKNFSGRCTQNGQYNITLFAQEMGFSKDFPIGNFDELGNGVGNNLSFQLFSEEASSGMFSIQGVNLYYYPDNEDLKYPLTIEKLIDYPNDKIIFKRDGLEFGTLADDDIIGRLVENVRFTVELRDVPDSFTIPDEIIKISQKRSPMFNNN